MSEKLVNVGGRPRHYKTPEAMQAMVDFYVANCAQNKEPVTWTGMALFLGFCSRQELDNYAKYDGFSDIVKRAKMIVENAYEIRAFTGGNAAGPIFVLKNMGWSDKQELDLRSGDGSMTPRPLSEFYAARQPDSSDDES